MDEYHRFEYRTHLIGNAIIISVFFVPAFSAGDYLEHIRLYSFFSVYGKEIRRLDCISAVAKDLFCARMSTLHNGGYLLALKSFFSTRCFRSAFAYVYLTNNLILNCHSRIIYQCAIQAISRWPRMILGIKKMSQAVSILTLCNTECKSLSRLSFVIFDSTSRCSVSIFDMATLYYIAFFDPDGI